MLTQKLVRELFDYDDTAERHHRGFHMRGGLIRRNPPIRTICGTLTPEALDSRARVQVTGIGLVALHRVIWTWHNGPTDPDKEVVDHQDCDPSHNRIRNFRLLSKVGNTLNVRRGRPRSKVPYLGVSPLPGGRRFRTYFTENGRQEALGCFGDAITAALARDEVAEAKAPGVATLNRELFPEVCVKFHLKTKI